MVVKTEADFQALLYGITELARIQNKGSHYVRSELQAQYHKRIDSLFIPIEGKSETVIIHEYKQIDKTNGKEELLEDGLWQIYVNRYMSVPIRDKEKHDHNDYWQTIKIRSLIFFKDTNNEGKWSVDMKEYEHSFKQAKEVYNN